MGIIMGSKQVEREIIITNYCLFFFKSKKAGTDWRNIRCRCDCTDSWDDNSCCDIHCMVSKCNTVHVDYFCSLINKQQLF